MTDLTYASARGKWVLTATVLGSGVASLDATVVEKGEGNGIHDGRIVFRARRDF